METPKGRRPLGRPGLRETESSGIYQSSGLLGINFENTGPNGESGKTHQGCKATE